MNTLIILATLIIGGKFLSHTNQKVMCVFIFPVLAFNYFGEEYISLEDSYYYYFLAAVTDSLIILALSKFPYKTKFASRLQLICIAFMFANLFGWIIYRAELEPDNYDMICTILYLWVLISTIGGIKNVLGNIGMDSRYPRVFSNHPKSDYIVPAYKTETRN